MKKMQLTGISRIQTRRSIVSRHFVPYASHSWLGKCECSLSYGLHVIGPLSLPINTGIMSSLFMSMIFASASDGSASRVS